MTDDAGQERRAKLHKTGMVLCILGLIVALLSFVPAVVPEYSLPWPVFVGSFIYLPGASLIFFGAKGSDRQMVFNQIRMIRLGFLAVIAILITRILSMP